MRAFLLFLLLLLAVFSFPTQAIGFDFDEEEDAPILFSDSNFSQPGRNFSPKQMVYVRVTAGSGDKQKTLRLLDSEKKELKGLTFNQSGNIYTVSFAAPASPGIYYVDIKIEGEGSSYAHQENLMVGGVQGGSVTAEAESQVITGGKDQSYRVEVLGTPEPVIIPPPAVGSQSPESQAATIVSQILEFLRSFFSRLKFW